MIDLVHRQLLEGKDIFDKECDKVGAFLDRNPTLYKVVLVASHVFRAISMYAMMESLPLHPVVSMGLLLIPSLLYRSAVERFCKFRFSLPSAVGGLAIWVGRAALISCLAGVAFVSISSSLCTGLGFLALGGYACFICNISHLDVEAGRKLCCHKEGVA